MRSIGAWKRVGIAALTAACLAATCAVALGDPLEDLKKVLFKVDNVQATGYSPTVVLVSWTDHSLVETSFRIEMAIGDETAPYTTVGFAPKCDNSPSASPDSDPGKTCSISLTGLGVPASDPTPLFFRVRPIIETPTGSADATQATKPTPGKGVILVEGPASAADPALLGPVAPTELTCNGGVPGACDNVTSITLRWTDNSDEQSFLVWRGSGDANVQFGSAPWATLPPDTTEWHETNSDYGKSYSYRVVAMRERSIPRADPEASPTTERSYSSTARADATTPDFVSAHIAPIPAPNDPSGLTVQFVAPHGALLTWSDQTPPSTPFIDEDGFFIDLGPVWNGFESTLTAPGAHGQGTRTYLDNSLTADTVRCYEVRSYRFGPAYSAPTNYVCIGALPRAPTGLTATALSNTSVSLTWKDNSDVEDGYVVERCLGACTQSSPGWVTNAEIDGNSTSYTDTETVGLTRYSYRVRARNATGPSAPSNISSVLTPVPPVRTPADLQAFPRTHAIFLTWVDVALDETGYRIEYHNVGDDWTKLVDLDRNTEAYLDADGLGVHQTRYYRVRALKNTSMSDPSNEAFATTLDKQLPNGTPSAIHAVTDSNTSIMLTWKDNSTNETAFRIEALAFSGIACSSANPNDQRFTFLKNAVPVDADGNPYDVNGTGTRSFQVKGLVPHTAYFFKLKAINPDGESDFGLASPAAGTLGDLPTITDCAQTYGPKKPVFIHPDGSGSPEASRCDFTVNASRVAGIDKVGGIMVYVLATVPGTEIAHTDILYVIGPGGNVPGAPTQDDPAHNKYVIHMTEGGWAPTIVDNEWTIAYHFRHGFQYKLTGVNYADAAPYWGSAQTVLADAKVLADCPTSGV